MSIAASEQFDPTGCRIRVIVHEMPCRITMDGVRPLTESMEAVFEDTLFAPAGPVLFIRDIEGNRIGVCARDLHNGRVDFEIEMPE
jgi:hypothetical protein